MNVQDLTSSLQESPSVLLDNIREQFNRRVKLPLSNFDDEVVSELTGIYQQTLKENGLEDGIQAEGTISLLGYEQDISVNWDPGILLSPDLLTWAQGQSEEIRARVNYIVSLLVVAYRELVSQGERFVREQIEQVQEDYAEPLLADVSERLDRVEQRLNDFRSNPVDETISLLFG